MLAAFLALTASLFWGASDYAAGIMGRRTTVWAVVLLTQLAGLVATGFVVLGHGTGLPPLNGWLPGVLSGLAGIVAVLCFYKALAIGIMSLVAPITSTGIIVPVLVGLVLGERPSTLQFAGMALAVGGVVLATRETETQHPITADEADPELDDFALTGPAGAVPAPEHVASNSHAGQEPGRDGFTPTRLSLVLAVVAALAIGLSYVGMDAAAVYDPFWGVFLMRATSSPLVVLYLLLRRPALHLSRGAVLPILLVGVGDTTANTLFSVASTHGYLSVVGVLGYLYPVVTVMLAHVLLRERLQPWQAAAASAALFGAILVAAG